MDLIDNKYTIIRHITNGTFSSVYLVKDNNNNNNQYIAKIRIINVNGYAQELQITQIVSQTNNPYIILLVDYGNGPIQIGGVQNNSNYLILDYCPKRNLLHFIQNVGFNEKYAKFIFFKIVKAVNAIHNCGIYHRNLNLEDILLDNNYELKISDFCVAVRTNNPLNDVVGKQRYRPPQMNMNLNYNGEKADVFSLGVILFKLVTGIFGFQIANNQHAHYLLIINRQYNQYFQILPQENITNLSHEFKSLYIKMISFNEKDRPTLDYILNDNYFNEIKNLNETEHKLLDLEIKNEFILRDH